MPLFSFFLFLFFFFSSYKKHNTLPRVPTPRGSFRDKQRDIPLPFFFIHRTTIIDYIFLRRGERFYRTTKRLSSKRSIDRNDFIKAVQKGEIEREKVAKRRAALSIAQRPTRHGVLHFVHPFLSVEHSKLVLSWSILSSRTLYICCIFSFLTQDLEEIFFYPLDSLSNKSGKERFTNVERNGMFSIYYPRIDESSGRFSFFFFLSLPPRPITCSAFQAGSFFWVALYDNVCTLLALSCSRIEQLTN